MPRLLLALAVVSSLAFAPSRPQAAPSPPPRQDDTGRRAVLVTGASSGIGRKTAEHLAAHGFFVYAGARKEADLAELDALDHVQAIRLDVTKQEEIDAAVKTVREAGRGLFGLVNNAGVAVFGPLIELSEADMEHQLGVNVWGPWRVTKAFAPLLIESRGRVLTTGSISGAVCWPMGGAYCMSKHAVEAFTDSLAMELAPFGVTVGVVDPGNYRSDIEANARERMREQGRGGEGSRFGAAMELMLRGTGDRSQYKEPDEVAEAYLRALADEKPKRRSLVVPNQREAETTIRAALARVVQWNEKQPWAYDRDELVALLDQALAASAK